MAPLDDDEFCPYDGVVLLWTSFDRAPSAFPLQEEGGRVALLRLSFQLPRAACPVSAIVRVWCLMAREAGEVALGVAREAVVQPAAVVEAERAHGSGCLSDARL